MANKEHIKWFLEGVDSWNKRRQKEPFKPDFEGANIPELLGTHVNSFEGVNLSNGFFHHTNFSGLNLKRADLRNSQLSGAILKNVDLSEANLQDAELKGADLRAAKLIQANFTNTKPWESFLFSEEQNQDWHLHIPPKPIPPKEVTEVMTLVNICKELKDYYEDKLEKNFFGGDCQLYYRGQCKKEWELSPSVMRPPRSETYPFREKEGERLLSLMSRRPEDFTGAPSALSQWVVAQHHSLKTRLLDITRNPLVALFHACENFSDPDDYCDDDGRLYIFAVPKLVIKPFDSDAISVVANLAKLPRDQQDLLMGKELDIKKFRENYPLHEHIEDSCYRSIMVRLYHHIGQEKPHFKERISIRDLLRVFVVEPQQSFERIRAQSGAFLISALHKRFETGEIRSFNEFTPGYHLYEEITVPAESKKNILQELRLLNITREILFPSLQEVAKAVDKETKLMSQEDPFRRFLT